MGKFHWKLAGCVILAILALGVVTRWLNRSHASRNAGSFLEQANAALESGDLDQAVKYLSRYLKFRPNDTEAVVTLAQTLEKTASTPKDWQRVVGAMERVLRLDQHRHDIRRRLVQINIDWARFSDAQHHLGVLIGAFPEDAALERLMGICHEGEGKYADAARAYEAAISHAPDQIESYVRLAVLMRRRLNKSPQEADEVIERMVAANEQSFLAYLARARYRKEFASPNERANEEDIAHALELAPDEADVILAVADLAVEKAAAAQAKGEADLVHEHLSEAREALRRGYGLHAQDSRMYLALAAVERQSKQAEEAIGCLRRGLEAVSGTDPRRADLMWNLTELLIERGDLDEAREQITELNAKPGLVPGLPKYLEARLLLQEQKPQKWYMAAVKLEEVRPLLTRAPELEKQVDVLLGQCYGQLADPDRQLAAYRRLVKANPLGVPGRMGVASALLAQGKIDEALAEYQQMMSVPEVSVVVARLLMLRNLRLPEGERNWREVDAALKRADQAAPESVELPILHARVAAARNDLAAARTVLERARERQPDRVEFWVALADLADEQGDREQAAATLAESERQFGDRVELRTAKVRHYTRQGGDEAKQALAAVAQDIGHLAETDKTRMLAALADAYVSLGDNAQALEFLQDAASMQPDNLRVRLMLLDLAAQQGNESILRQTLEGIRLIEGPGGPMGNLAEASTLIRSNRRDKEKLRIARDLLADAAKRRPTWAPVPKLQAQLDELEGNQPRAIESYQRAIELGERNPRVLQRLIQLLHQHRRFDEAAQALRELDRQGPISADLQVTASEIWLRTNEMSRALDLARQAVVAEPQDYRQQLWLGQVLRVSAQRELVQKRTDAAQEHLKEAELALRTAVQLADNVPDTWLVLVIHLVDTGQREQAEAAVEEAKLKISGDQAALALAQCYELIGAREKAEEKYRAALEVRPDDVVALRTVASFYLRLGQSQQAEAYLRKITEPAVQAPAAESAWARRTLAVLAAARGDRKDAVRLVDENLDSFGASAEDLRTKARLLAGQNSRRARQEAIGLLERLMERYPHTAQDEFMLAQLHQAEGNWSKARVQMRSLVGTNGTKPIYVAAYVRTLIGQGDLSEAEIWANRLEDLEPQSFRTIATQARLLGAQGKGDEIREVFKSHLQTDGVESVAEAVSKALRLVAEDKPGEALAIVDAYAQGSDDEPTSRAVRQIHQLMAQNRSEEATALFKTYLQSKAFAAGLQILRVRTAAGILEEFGQSAAAEETYRQYVSLSPRPESMLELVTFLARQERLDEALDLCEKAWDTCSPAAVAAASVAVLRGATPNPRQVARVERWLDSAIEKTPNDASLLLPLADLRDRQERFDQAEAIYRQIIGLDARNVIAMNNLAWLLAQKGGKGAAEALTLIIHAIEIAGPAAELLDTRASVYLALGQPDKAIEDLNQAIDATPVGAARIASKYFHLAQAHRLSKGRNATDGQQRVTEAWAQAKAAGFNASRLHPLERKAYEKLMAELQPN